MTVDPRSLVATISGGDVGSIINQLLAGRLQKKALGGDEGALVSLAGRDPRRAQAVTSSLQGREDLTQKRNSAIGRVAQGFADAQDKKGFLGAAAQELRDEFPDLADDIEEDFQRFDAEPDSVLQEYSAGLSLFSKSGATQAPAGQRQFEALIADFSPEDQKTARRIQARIDAPAGLTAEDIGDREAAKLREQLKKVGDIAAEKAGGTKSETRIQGYIEAGVDAADSIGNLARSLELLESIETGGFNAAALRAKQTMGIESADEGELANKLGLAVLQQLKPIFGAAFTAAEGERLERLSGGFGKSTAANKRILKEQLKIVRRAANRGLRAAKSRGLDFEAAEIQRALDRVNGVIDSTGDTKAPTDTQSGQKQGGQIMVDANGNRARVFADGTFEEL